MHDPERVQAPGPVPGLLEEVHRDLRETREPDRGAFVPHHSQCLGRVDPVLAGERRPGGNRRHQRHDARHVEQRQRVPQHVVGRQPVPVVAEGLAGPHHRLVRQHRALGPRGRPGCVHDEGRVADPGAGAALPDFAGRNRARVDIRDVRDAGGRGSVQPDDPAQRRGGGRVKAGPGPGAGELGQGTGEPVPQGHLAGRRLADDEQ